MVKQYESYTYPELGNISVNGINTLGENIADNGGIKTSYKAYSKSQSLSITHLTMTSSCSESWVSQHGPEPLLPGLALSPAQLFWVSGASVWCARHRPGDLRMAVTLGTHTPSNYRIQVCQTVITFLSLKTEINDDLL